MNASIKTSIAVASAAAALFAMSAGVTTVQAASHGGMAVKCSGVNSCKGTSDCKTATNECKGQNSCKGHGWNMKASAKECTTAGGKVIK